MHRLTRDIRPWRYLTPHRLSAFWSRPIVTAIAYGVANARSKVSPLASLKLRSVRITTCFKNHSTFSFSAYEFLGIIYNRKIVSAWHSTAVATKSCGLQFLARHPLSSLERIVALLPCRSSRCPSVRPSGTGVHCDHTVHSSSDLS